MGIGHPKFGKIDLPGAVGLDGGSPQSGSVKQYAEKMSQAFTNFIEGKKPDLCFYFQIGDSAHDAIHATFVGLLGGGRDWPTIIDGGISQVVFSDDRLSVVRTFMNDAEGEICGVKYEGVVNEDGQLARKQTVVAEAGQLATLSAIN